MAGPEGIKASTAHITTHAGSVGDLKKQQEKSQVEKDKDGQDVQRTTGTDATSRAKESKQKEVKKEQAKKAKDKIKETKSQAFQGPQGQEDDEEQTGDMDDMKNLAKNRSSLIGGEQHPETQAPAQEKEIEKAKAEPNILRKATVEECKNGVAMVNGEPKLINSKGEVTNLTVYKDLYSGMIDFADCLDSHNNSGELYKKAVENIMGGKVLKNENAEPAVTKQDLINAKNSPDDLRLQRKVQHAILYDIADNLSSIKPDKVPNGLEDLFTKANLYKEVSDRTEGRPRSLSAPQIIKEQKLQEKTLDPTDTNDTQQDEEAILATAAKRAEDIKKYQKMMMGMSLAQMVLPMAMMAIPFFGSVLMGGMFNPMMGMGMGMMPPMLMPTPYGGALPSTAAWLNTL